MSRRTWMECIVWVSAIAVISSISRHRPDFLVSYQSDAGSTPISGVSSPDCDKADRERLRFGLINISQISTPESACESFRRRDQQYRAGLSQDLGFSVRLMASVPHGFEDSLGERTKRLDAEGSQPGHR